MRGGSVLIRVRSVLKPSNEATDRRHIKDVIGPAERGPGMQNLRKHLFSE